MSFIKLHRSLMDSELWQGEKFSRGQAWVDLILSAAYKDHHFFVRGNKVNIKRGQVAMSKLTMAKRWGWSRDRVTRFLTALQTARMISHQTSQLTTLVTICNYNKFQDSTTPDKTTDKTANKTANKTQSRSKEYNNNIMVKFDAFWSAYPRKVGKQETLKKWAALSEDDHTAILADVSNRKFSDDPKFIQHPKTYLNSKRWEDSPCEPENKIFRGAI